jgi:hypothetical protein
VVSAVLSEWESSQSKRKGITLTSSSSLASVLQAVTFQPNDVKKVAPLDEKEAEHS